MSKQVTCPRTGNTSCGFGYCLAGNNRCYLRDFNVTGAAKSTVVATQVVVDPTPTREAHEAAAEVIGEIMVRCLAAGTSPSDSPEILCTVIESALDAFARTAVKKERETVASWLDCTNQCRYVNASGICQRTDQLCSHHVAESIRAGESP